MDASNLSIPHSELLGHAGWARALARSLVSDAASADDLAQDALLAALEAPPQRRDNLRGWLASVMRRRAGAQAVRERARVGVEAEARAPTADAAPDARAAEHEQRGRLAALVQALDEPYRATLLMRYWHGLEPTEIARRLGVPAGTVRWRLKVALDRLRDGLDREERGGRRAWVLALLPLASRDSAPAAATAVPGVLALALGAAAALALVVAWRVSDDAPGDAQLAAVAPQPVEAAPRDDGPTPDSGATRAPAPAAPVASAAAAEQDGAGRVRVEARAVDGAGRPVSGARLSLARSTAGEVGSAAGAADGRVTLELPADWTSGSRTLRFLLSAPGRATVVLEGSPAAGAIGLGEVALDPGGTLFGRVLDPRGRPLADAWVQARSAGDAWGEDERLALLRSDGRTSARHVMRVARADERGHFELPGLGLGAWQVAAGARGFAPVLGARVEVEAGVEREIEALRVQALPPERCISGRVLDGQGRAPGAARVLVEGRGALGSVSFSEPCDAAGAFLVVLPARIERADLTAHDRLRPGTEARRSDVAVGTQGLELRLVEPATLALRLDVRGPDGAALDNVRVRALRAEDSGATELNPSVERAPDGTLALVLPRVPFVLEVDAPGMASRRLGPFEPDAAPERIEVDLAEEALVRGRVTGLPATGARVSLWAQTTGTSQADGFAVRVEPKPLLERDVDGDGSFALAVPAPQARRAGRSGRSTSGFGGFGEVPAQVRRGGGSAQRVYLRVEVEGLAPLEVGPLDPAATGAIDLGELAPTPGGTIAGHVVSGDGVGVAGARVVASRGDARPRAQVVGDDGRFAFEHLTPGAWEVRLVEPSDVRASRVSFSSFSGVGDLEAPEIPASCSVAEGGTTTLELTRESVPAVLALSLRVDGRPVSDARAWWCADGDAPDVAEPADAIRADALGALSLRRAAPGNARLALECEALDVRLFSERRLERGEQARTLALASATVDVLGPAGEGDVWLVCAAGSALGLRRLDGQRRELRVPAGALRLVRFAAHEPPGPTGGTTLAETSLAAGGRAELRLP